MMKNRILALGYAALLCALLTGLFGCNGTVPDAGQTSGQTSSTEQGASAGQTPSNGSNANANRAAATPAGSDIVIPLAEITEQARFYPTTVDDIGIEVLAVKAPDGSIRTAFNTCQVCYDSGRGYYEQEGSVLVCQNCGNRFAMDDVEIKTGGCNPVPIFDDDKTVTDENITISASYLREARGIFENWKQDY